MNDEALEATYQATLDLLEELRRDKANERVEMVVPNAKRSQRSRARPALRFPKIPKSRKPQTRRLLTAHTNKVMDCCWGERDTMVSCARDGTVHVWDVKKSTRAVSWKTPGSWTMTCCLDGGVVAVGGLDNLCSIYVLPE
jgi:WD40 repeat protein